MSHTSKGKAGIKPVIRKLHKSADGRTWWIDEGHPDTNKTMVIARSVENGKLVHTGIWARSLLTAIDVTRKTKC